MTGHYSDLGGDTSSVWTFCTCLKFSDIISRGNQCWHHNLFSQAGFEIDYSCLSHCVSVDKSSLMVGSYGPKAEPHEYLTPPEDAPKGMLARGHYIAKSKFVDDDKNCHLEWEWAFDITKDWQ